MNYSSLALITLTASIFSSPLVLSVSYAASLEAMSTSKTEFDNQKPQESTLVQHYKSDLKEASTTIIRTRGSLDSRNEQWSEDGSLYEVHSFNGQADQDVVIQMNSSAFDTYLMLLNSSGEVVAQNDDYQGSTDSLVTATLPSDDKYSVIANSYNSSGRDSYTLVVTGTSSTETQPTQNSTEVIAQANQGVVEGTVGFPSDYKPATVLCAQSASNLYLMSCVDSPRSDSRVPFRMALDPGDYYFFSYLDEVNSQGRRGFFYFHTPSSNRSGNSHQPRVVSVRSSQIISGVHVGDSRTCSDYSQYCIAPPSASNSGTSSRSSTTPRLRFWCLLQWRVHQHIRTQWSILLFRIQS